MLPYLKIHKIKNNTVFIKFSIIYLFLEGNYKIVNVFIIKIVISDLFD